MQFRRVHSDLPRLVNGGEAPPISKELAEAYRRAFAFCPKHGALSQLAKELRSLMRAVLVAEGLCTKEDIPTHASIVLVARSLEGVSLQLLSQVNHALRLIIRHRDLEPLAELAQYICDSIGEDGFCKNAYVLCLHALRPALPGTPYGDFRAALTQKDEKLSGPRYFSTKVLEGTALDKHKPHLMVYLEQGPHPNEPGKGCFKISEETARLIYDALVEFGRGHGLEAPTFDEVFSFGAQEGPRNGHSSRALGRNQGNVIPGEEAA